MCRTYVVGGTMEVKLNVFQYRYGRDEEKKWNCSYPLCCVKFPYSFLCLLHWFVSYLRHDFVYILVD
jgi:hypothetical protein